MTQEEIRLLLIDLCTRLPYGVKVDHFGVIRELLDVIPSTEIIMVGYDINNYEDSVIEDIKPYLRPMSSMTEDERLELSRLTNDKFKFYLYSREPEIICYEKYNYLEGLKVLDWLNTYHFDYRGLIPMELALEAPEGMYKSE